MQTWQIFHVKVENYKRNSWLIPGWYYETPSGDVCGPYKTDIEAQSAMQKERGWNKG
jgi:hypothetical protein